MKAPRFNHLSRRATILLVIYFTALLIASTTTLVSLLAGASWGGWWFEAKPGNGFLAAICGSLIGSSIYYVRKLYKNLHAPIPVTASQNYEMQHLGYVIYYCARPVFAAAFGFIGVVALQSGHRFISESPELKDGNFVYATATLGFLVGFSCGKVINRLESKAKDI
jgi:hypothetical protein